MAASTLKVLYTPQYISVDEFARIFAPLEGYQTCRLVKGQDGEQIGFVEFNSLLAAEKARGIYNDWQGWGPKGLQIDIAMTGADQSGAGVKRGREDLMADGGAFKQQRTDQASNMGYGAAQTVKQELPNGTYSVQAAPLANGYDTSNPTHSPGAAYGQQQVNLGAAANAPQYGLVGQAASVQQATTDPRFGVPPRISPSHQAPGSYTQEAYNASGKQAPSATQYPSQAAPAAAQPAQYGALQVQYPSQASSLQASQYPGSTTAQAGQYTPQQLAPGQTTQQPLQQQAGYTQSSAQVPTYSAQPQGTQYVQQAPTQSQYPSTVQQPAYQQGAQQVQAQQQQTTPQQPQQQAYMGMPSQVPQPQAPQQPAPSPGVQYPTPAPPQYPPQQQPQQPPPMQMAPPTQPGGHLPGQMMPQAAPMVQSAQMQYAAPPPAAPVAQFPPVRPDQQPYRDGPPPRFDDRLPEGRQRGPPPDELPPDAASTIYVDGLPLEVNKRELAHIFRPFHGYLDLRIIHKRDKNDREIVIAFAEFADVYSSTACMRLLQNYPWDLDAENSPVLRLSYARPPKALQDRNRAGPPDSRGGPRGSYDSYPNGGGRRPNYREDDRDRGRHSGFTDTGGRGGSSRPPPRSTGSDRAPPRVNGRGRP